MIKIAITFLILLITFNSYSFVEEVPLYIKIIGHSLFMPFLGLIYGIKRKWQFGQVDQLILFVCMIGCVGDIIIFFDLQEKGKFLQIVAAFFAHLVFIIIFKREGAYVFTSNSNINILKVIIPVSVSFFFFGFVLLNLLPNVLYFGAIIYSVQVTILTVLGYFRPTKNRSYWAVAVGVSVIIVKDILYSYYFYVFKGSFHSLYIPMYWSNAIGYFLIIYGISLNQNEEKSNYEKISYKLVLTTFLALFQKKEIRKAKFSIYDDRLHK
ncbi:hypothetical protein GCM10027035_41550 [Emticicia sediminis]